VPSRRPPGCAPGVHCQGGDCEEREGGAAEEHEHLWLPGQLRLSGKGRLQPARQLPPGPHQVTPPPLSPDDSLDPLRDPSHPAPHPAFPHRLGPPPQIINVLVTDIEPAAKVKAAMNEINAAQRLRLAAYEQSEADKVCGCGCVGGSGGGGAVGGWTACSCLPTTSAGCCLHTPAAAVALRWALQHPARPSFLTQPSPCSPLPAGAHRQGGRGGRGGQVPGWPGYRAPAPGGQRVCVCGGGGGLRRHSSALPPASWHCPHSTHASPRRHHGHRHGGCALCSLRF
jgi:hypothetical protein